MTHTKIKKDIHFILFYIVDMMINTLQASIFWLSSQDLEVFISCNLYFSNRIYPLFPWVPKYKIHDSDQALSMLAANYNLRSTISKSSDSSTFCQLCRRNPLIWNDLEPLWGFIESENCLPSPSSGALNYLDIRVIK